MAPFVESVTSPRHIGVTKVCALPCSKPGLSFVFFFWDIAESFDSNICFSNEVQYQPHNEVSGRNRRNRGSRSISMGKARHSHHETKTRVVRPSMVIAIIAFLVSNATRFDVKLLQCKCPIKLAKQKKTVSLSGYKTVTKSQKHAPRNLLLIGCIRLFLYL